MQFQSQGWEDPLEKGMTALSITLAWLIPWQTNLVGQRPQDLKESDMTELLSRAQQHQGYSNNHLTVINRQGLWMC